MLRSVRPVSNLVFPQHHPLERKNYSFFCKKRRAYSVLHVFLGAKTSFAFEMMLDYITSFGIQALEYIE